MIIYKKLPIIFNIYLVLHFCLLLPASEYWSNSNPHRFSEVDLSHAVWHETFDRTSDNLPFTVEFKDGAKGRIEILPLQGRHGGAALHTSKTNAQGYIVLRFKSIVPVKAGQLMQGSTFYRTLKSETRYSLAMFRLQPPGQTSFPRFNYGQNGGYRLQEAIGTAYRTWERKIALQKAQQKDSGLEVVLILAGAPSDILWDDFYVEDNRSAAATWKKTLKRRTPEDRTSLMLPLTEIKQRLRHEPDHTGEIKQIKGKSRLFIDGKISVPVINSPYIHPSNGKYVSNTHEFAQKGIHLVKVGIRLGTGYPEHRFAGCWNGGDDFNLEKAIVTFWNTLRMDPQARIILSLMLHPYWRFCQDYPEESWIDENGNTVCGDGIHLRESNTAPPSSSKHYPWPSYQSEILKQFYITQIKKILGELKKYGLTKMIVGIHIGGGHDNQMTLKHLDYSSPSIKYFRKYLKEKYKTAAALRRAWHHPTVTFSTAEAPRFHGNKDCLDPRTEQNFIDFYKASKLAPWRMASDMAAVCRQILGKSVFTMRWCQGPYSGYPMTSLDIDDFLYHQNFDILVAQASYNVRPPAAACVAGVPLDSFHLNRKIYVNEFDLRTWNAAPSWEKEIQSLTWGLLIDAPMWRAAHRKLSGSMIANDMGYWYLDMAPGWFDHPAIMNDIGETTITGQQFAERSPSNWHKDSAFVVDNEGLFTYNLPSVKWKFDITMQIREQLELLGASGVPLAFISLQDLLRTPALAHQYKLLIFAGMNYIDAPRLKLLDSLKNSNRTLVFLSGSGQLGGCEKGTGFLTRQSLRQLNHNIIPEKGIKEKIHSIWTTITQMALNRPPQWYEYITINYAEDLPGDRIVARFEANHQPAILERRHDGWKSVYIGEAGGMTPDYFNHLVREARAYYTTKANFQCDTNGNFLSIHCLQRGTAVFHLPYKADVINLCNGDIYHGISQIKTMADAGATYWYSLSPAQE